MSDPRFPQMVQVQTRDGAAEAVKRDREDAWEISYPWGAARFYGTKLEVRAEMMRATEQHYYPSRLGPRMAR